MVCFIVLFLVGMVVRSKIKSTVVKILFVRPPPVRKIKSADTTRDGRKRSLISARARRENDSTNVEHKFPTVKLIGTNLL